jgi:cytochrome c-type biogenesis protein CcmH
MIRPAAFGLALLLSVPLAAPALAGEARPMGSDPAVEARLKSLGSELRCLVCQNQTLADSHADLAKDLRQEIREMMEQGKSDQEIVDYLVHRYGDFVLYRPPFKATTALLWAGPALLVVVGSGALVAALRRRRGPLADDAPLSDEEAARLRDLLGESGEKPGGNPGDRPA